MAEIENILSRIEEGIAAAREVFSHYQPGDVAVRFKQGDDPITEADNAVDEALRNILPRPGEGWLSEETADTTDRLACEDVWIVDPLDGTREFVSGIPEWCVSIGFIRNGTPIAGGICNPVTGQTILGAIGRGITYNGKPGQTGSLDSLIGARVTASRSEVRRGEWARFEGTSIEVIPCGSVAYKLGLVACGECDATWTLVPKNEWDVAAGVALVLAAGGAVYSKEGTPIQFNRPDTLLSGMIATSRDLAIPVADFLGISSLRLVSDALVGQAPTK